MAYKPEEIQEAFDLKLTKSILAVGYKNKNGALASNKKRFPDGELYIIKLKGFDIFKIGVSQNAKRRIKDIDSANPFGVLVCGIYTFKNVYEMEEMVHDNLQTELLRKEWFKVSPEVIVGIKNQLKELSEQGYYLIRK